MLPRVPPFACVAFMDVVAECAQQRTVAPASRRGPRRPLAAIRQVMAMGRPLSKSRVGPRSCRILPGSQDFVAWHVSRWERVPTLGFDCRKRLERTGFSE